MNRIYTTIESPIGDITLVKQGDALCGLYMEAHRHQPAVSTFGELRHVGFTDVEEQLSEYFNGERTDFDLKLAAIGNVFQHLVWDALRTIPYGETRSYGEIARQIGKPDAVRAVGTTNGQNPISIIVPCHRVIGANGKLVGYGGGLERKEFLLGLEKRRSEPLLFV